MQFLRVRALFELQPRIRRIISRYELVASFLRFTLTHSHFQDHTAVCDGKLLLPVSRLTLAEITEQLAAVNLTCGGTSESPPVRWVHAATTAKYRAQESGEIPSVSPTQTEAFNALWSEHWPIIMHGVNFRGGWTPQSFTATHGNLSVTLVGHGKGKCRRVSLTEFFHEFASADNSGISIKIKVSLYRYQRSQLSYGFRIYLPKMISKRCSTPVIETFSRISLCHL